MTGSKVYFVRHGEYDPESSEIALTDTGRRQAKAAGATLAQLGMQGALVLSSAANRAKQTADEITVQIEGSGPYASQDLWFKSMAPHSIDDLDELLVDIAASTGEYDPSKPIVAVAHAELLSVLPGNSKSIAAVAFCEMVEYHPGTWAKPAK